MADIKKCLCIDVGGTAIKHGIIDSSLNLADKGEVATPYDGVEAYLDTLELIFRRTEGQVQGIAMSVPGVHKVTFVFAARSFTVHPMSPANKSLTLSFFFPATA